MSQCLTPQRASGCGVSPTRPASAALVAGCLLFFARESFAAVLRIEEIRTTASGEVALSFRASLDHYYILERCESLADPMRPTRLVLPILETNTLTDSLAGTSAFYRLRTVPLSDPLDTDGDGLDDAYELRRGPVLNPLAPGDASQPTSNRPLTPWQEYRLAWFVAGTRRIAAGDHHVLALAEDGTLWGCGENRSGQLGNGTTNSVVDLISLQPANRWRAVGAGGSQSFAIREDGTLWAWGKGALGDGSTTNHLVPIQVAQDTNWACVVASQNHVAGLKQDQSLWAWGDNAAGQLGDGSTEPRAAPVSIGPGD